MIATSGLFVNATATVQSGAVYLASGHGFFWSGQIIPASGMLSGQPVAANAVVASGTVFLASGHGYYWSGQLWLASGALSGQQVVTTVASGTTYLASGGVFLASGHNLFWSGQLYPQSGLSVLVNSGTLSGHPITPLSGFTFVASGTVRLASGQQVVAASVTDKSGYTLTASGLDTIPVEAGMNVRQALSVAAAGVAGRLAGAGTALIRIEAAGVSGTIRISGAFDASGNRDTSFLNLPG